MFKMKVMEKCPYTRGSHGIITMPHDAIAAISGAVDGDDHEWMILFKGLRSKDGTKVVVREIEVPEHKRSLASCTLPEGDVDPAVVAVGHSHHSMSAFFSNTDHTRLNPRFPASIVFARLNARGGGALTPAERSLGFRYQAEVRATLPCGSIGIVEAHLEPFPRPAFWDTEPAVLKADSHNDLGDCDNYEDGQEKLPEHLHGYLAKCGERETSRRLAYFGDDGAELLLQIKKRGTVSVTVKSQGYREHRSGHRRYVTIDGVLTELDSVEDNLGSTQHWGMKECQ